MGLKLTKMLSYIVFTYLLRIILITSALDPTDSGHNFTMSDSLKNNTSTTTSTTIGEINTTTDFSSTIQRPVGRTNSIPYVHTSSSNNMSLEFPQYSDINQTSITKTLSSTATSELSSNRQSVVGKYIV